MYVKFHADTEHISKIIQVSVFVFHQIIVVATALPFLVLVYCMNVISWRLGGNLNTLKRSLTEKEDEAGWKQTSSFFRSSVWESN